MNLQFLFRSNFTLQRHFRCCKRWQSVIVEIRMRWEHSAHISIVCCSVAPNPAQAFLKQADNALSTMINQDSNGICSHYVTGMSHHTQNSTESQEVIQKPLTFLLHYLLRTSTLMSGRLICCTRKRGRSEVQKSELTSHHHIEYAGIWWKTYQYAKENTLPH